MLLADTIQDLSAHPVDVFKQTHVPKAGEKAVPDKPTNLIHCANESLLGIAQIKRGYKAQSKWSSEFKEFECIGDDRQMDRTLKEARAREKAEVEREAKLAEYFSQP